MPRPMPGTWEKGMRRSFESSILKLREKTATRDAPTCLAGSAILPYPHEAGHCPGVYTAVPGCSRGVSPCKGHLASLTIPVDAGCLASILQTFALWIKTPKDQGRKHRRAGSAQLKNDLQPLLRMALKPMTRAHYKDV
ncbi:hypothetical protein [Cupriavidus basilensis]|uniref:Uncharacterized protein n=1 Tax=Cupriavidus basilensis TaxID=68895 RepID=A0A643FY74_9BURK|nr:hypothetical protein [Cupriavidus basilensis]QOT80454.1 hypothetical protein F7R26_023705 [Cupriavidus basilensis]